MYNIKNCFFLFFIIFTIYSGLTLFFEESPKDFTFMVLAMDDSSIFTSLLPISTNVQD